MSPHVKIARTERGKNIYYMTCSTIYNIPSVVPKSRGLEGVRSNGLHFAAT
jgi:hypothetical protein